MEPRDIIPLYRSASTPTDPNNKYVPGALVNNVGLAYAVLTDNNGVLIGSTDITLDQIITASGTIGLEVASFNYTLAESSGISYRIRMLPSNADAQAAAQNGLQGVVSRNQLFNGTTWDRVYSLASSGDAQVAAQVGLTGTVARNQLFNGATFDRQRGANVFKTVDTAASGNTAVWTPASGKKFRLMGGIISVSGTVAALTADAIQLRDGAGTAILNFRAALAVTVTGDTQIPFDLGQGYLSAAANNVLNVNIATALTAGGVSVNVWGTEE